MSLLAYHSDQSLKDDMLAEMAEHRAHDQLVKGTYGHGSNGDFRGCAVGCAVHSLNRKRGTKISYDDHKRLAEAIAFPEWLMYLVDGVFEGLPEEDAVKWPERVLNAVKPGADLSRVRYQLQHWILAESGLLTITDVNRDAINQVAALNLRAASGDAPSEGDWSAAALAAWSAARSAARSAWSAAFKKIANKTIELLEAA